MPMVLGLCLTAVLPTRADYLYVGNTGNNTVDKVDLSNGSITPLPITLNNAPTGLAVDGSGDVFVSTSQQVYEVTPGGNVSTVFAPGNNPSIYGLAVDSAGNLYIDEFYSGNIFQAPAGGGSVTLFASDYNYSNNSATSFPAALGVGNGNLYVLDNPTGRQDRIGIVSNGGVNPINSGLPPTGAVPNSLAFDPTTGNVFTVSGSAVIEVASNGTGNYSQFFYPNINYALGGLAMGSNGILYVVETPAQNRNVTANEVLELNASTGALEGTIGGFSVPVPIAFETTPGATAAPEPSSLVLFCIGCISFAFGWHRRRRGGRLAWTQSV